MSETKIRDLLLRRMMNLVVLETPTWSEIVSICLQWTATMLLSATLSSLTATRIQAKIDEHGFWSRGI